jgi:thiamine pyrophosphate-dependent acetolactate synthase large subunit-like protein
MFQAWKVKPGQTFVANMNTGSMGMGIPSAIGAYLATGRRVILVEGEGGMQLNLPSLQVMVRETMNIRVICAVNNGYQTIRASQVNTFKRKVGADPESGMTFPDMQKVFDAFGLLRVASLDSLFSKKVSKPIGYVMHIDPEDKLITVRKHYENGQARMLDYTDIEDV